MGFDPENYASYGSPEFQYLICIICDGVYDNPVECPQEHLFCRKCITEWLKRDATCPFDRKPLRKEHLISPPRYFKQMIGSLRLNCLFKWNGCQETFDFKSNLDQHLVNCPFVRVLLWDHDYCCQSPDTMVQTGDESKSDGPKIMLTQDKPVAQGPVTDSDSGCTLEYHDATEFLYPNV